MGSESPVFSKEEVSQWAKRTPLGASALFWKSDASTGQMPFRPTTNEFKRRTLARGTSSVPPKWDG